VTNPGGTWRAGNVQDAYASYIAGGQAGYNVQLGRIVLGVEGDYGFSTPTEACRARTPRFFTCNAEVDNLMSGAGRAGVTWERALFYVKGGYAGGDVRGRDQVQSGASHSAVGHAHERHDQLGVRLDGRWRHGSFALTQQWSAKAEYMHYDLGSDRYTVD